MTDMQASSSLDDLSRLHQEHQELEQKLQAMMAKPFPSGDEQMEELRLKKYKLALKDRINALTGTGARSSQVA